jgi:HEPN domain-containing protein
LCIGERVPKQSDPHEWLRFAQDDLGAARLLLTDTRLPARMACFHAQQAAEKALKALLVHGRVQFRKTHDLAVLVALLTETEQSALVEIDVQRLQQWAVDVRYPADLPDITVMDAFEIVVIADNIVSVVESALRPKAGQADGSRS